MTIDLPPSVKELFIIDDGYIENVPAVKCLYPSDQFTNLSPDIEEIHDYGDVVYSREILENVTGLRVLETESEKLQWFPPWLKVLLACEFDKEAVANSSLHTIFVPSLAGMTLPRTLRKLKIRDYAGEELPPQLESLLIHSKVESDVPIRLPSGLKELDIKAAVMPSLPQGLKSLKLRYMDLSGVVFPEGLTDLYLTGCRGVITYPNRLEKLSFSFMSMIPPIPPTVRDASFVHCFGSPGTYSTATSLKTLKLENCLGELNVVPARVTHLTAHGTETVPLPENLVSLKCGIPVDFSTERERLSELRLDKFEWNPRMDSSPYSVADILACRYLRCLEFYY